MRSRGPVEDRLIFVIVAPSVVSATRGVELTPLVPMARVASFGELANGYVRVESRSVVRDGVDVAVMWHSTSP